MKLSVNSLSTRSLWVSNFNFFVAVIFMITYRFEIIIMDSIFFDYFVILVVVEEPSKLSVVDNILPLSKVKFLLRVLGTNQTVLIYLLLIRSWSWWLMLDLVINRWFWHYDGFICSFLANYFCLGLFKVLNLYLWYVLRVRWLIRAHLFRLRQSITHYWIK